MKYNDPIYVKLEKLDIMIRLSAQANIAQVTWLTLLFNYFGELAQLFDENMFVFVMANVLDKRVYRSLQNPNVLVRKFARTVFYIF